jgi:hypothetical protein
MAVVLNLHRGCNLMFTAGQPKAGQFTLLKAAFSNITGALVTTVDTQSRQAPVVISDCPALLMG